MIYVGYTTIPIDERDQSLRQLLEHYRQGSTFFFLRSLHQVSGIIMELPEQLSPEGQLFNAAFELRWKKRGRNYEILWLGQQAPGDTQIFTAIERQWQIEDHSALLHDHKTPQYPNRFNYPLGLKKQIQQRYFRDTETGVIHFIALTVLDPKSSDSSPT